MRCDRLCREERRRTLEETIQRPMWNTFLRKLPSKAVRQSCQTRHERVTSMGINFSLTYVNNFPSFILSFDEGNQTVYPFIQGTWDLPPSILGQRERHLMGRRIANPHFRCTAEEIHVGRRECRGQWDNAVKARIDAKVCYKGNGKMRLRR